MLCKAVQTCFLCQQRKHVCTDLQYSFAERKRLLTTINMPQFFARIPRLSWRKGWEKIAIRCFRRPSCELVHIIYATRSRELIEFFNAINNPLREKDGGYCSVAVSSVLRRLSAIVGCLAVSRAVSYKCFVVFFNLFFVCDKFD